MNEKFKGILHVIFLNCIFNGLFFFIKFVILIIFNNYLLSFFSLFLYTLSCAMSIFHIFAIDFRPIGI